uniref:Uncharacterized protein n=1 Tax=Vespula pensylvanica TaxID=30213 RepID=A0A834P3S2_VESPE|nr:hypothetical protein H0235_006530 [Vespula pensylvanica]
MNYRDIAFVLAHETRKERALCALRENSGLNGRSCKDEIYRMGVGAGYCKGNLNFATVSEEDEVYNKKKVSRIPTIACTPSSTRRMPDEFIFSQLEFYAEKFHAKVFAENEAVLAAVESLTYSYMSNLLKRFRLASSNVE